MRRTGLAVPFASRREFEQNCQIAKKWVSFPHGLPDWEKPARETHYELWLDEALNSAGLPGWLSISRSGQVRPIFIDYDSIPTPPKPNFEILIPEAVAEAHLGEDVFEEALRMGLLRVSDRSKDPPRTERP
jgi:hypothetical protein